MIVTRYCGQYDGCSRCATDPRCTWCEAGVGSCQESTNLDSTCPNTDDRKDGCDCNVCEPLTDCTSCVQSDEVCVWTGTECKSERADGAACDGKFAVFFFVCILSSFENGYLRTQKHEWQVLLERTVIVLATPLKSQIQYITQQQILFSEITVTLST